MATYRAEVGLSVEVASTEPLTEARLRAVISEAIRILDEPFTVETGAEVGVLDEPTISIDTPYCTAVNRRSSVDGRLYACQMTATSPIHGPVESCEQPGGCDRPGEHHAYVSPGWDGPIEAAS